MARSTGDPDRSAVLWVAGDGPETSALRHRYPDSEALQWLGVLDEDEKVRRLVGADVLAAPSLGGESFGLVVLEGMAAGTVVVASDIDGYRDAAGGRAVMVPPGESPALARALRGVLDGRLAPSCPAAGQDGPRDRGEWLRAGAERAASVVDGLVGRNLRGSLSERNGREQPVSGRTLHGP